jgi:hypothetical protein
LSYYYKGNELPARLAWFWSSYQATSIVGAFLAAAILNMRGVDGLPGWAWLFALEGTLTGLIGIATYFYLPPSPYQTASWFRGKKGWFNEREEKIIANRILRDDPSKADMHNRQAVTPKLLFYALCDWEMWPIYLIGLSFLIPNYPVFVAHPEAVFRPIRSEHAHYSSIRTVHHRPAILDVGIREDWSTIDDRPGPASLVYAAPYCIGGAPSARIEVGEVYVGDVACWRALHARHSSRSDEQECWVCED